MFVNWTLLLLPFFTCFFPNVLSSNLTDFSKCKIHYSRSETTYSTFFEVPEESEVNDTLLDFHFSVLARRDAHILFAPSDILTAADPVYEIVLGGGGNTFCEIRKLQKSDTKASKYINDILSAVDIRSFWVHMSKDGLLEIGKEGEKTSFLSWYDDDPLPIKVFSFSTYYDVDAKWYFDCEKNERGNEMKMLEPKLSHLQKLREMLLWKYDPYVRPVFDESQFTVITIELDVQHISMDERQAIMEVNSKLLMQWTDQKLFWDPTDFGDIKLLQIPFGKIWHPDFTLYNNVEPNPQIFKNGFLQVNHRGNVTCSTTINLKSWCDVSELGAWPSDVHSCTMLFSFLRDLSSVQLKMSNNSNLPENTSYSEWNVIGHNLAENVGWVNDPISDPPGLYLSFRLQRKSDMFKLIYLPPFIVIAVVMILSFWISPLSYMRILLISLVMILNSVVSIHLFTQLPGHPNKIPNLLVLYVISTMGLMGTLIISIIVINLTRNKYNYNLSHPIWKLLSFPIVQMILLLPNTKELKKSENLNMKPINMWTILGTVIDRLISVVYLVMFIYILTANNFFKT